MKSRHFIIPTLALAYAAFLVWWLNRGEEERTADSRPGAETAATSVPALLADRKGSGKIGGASGKDSKVTARRDSTNDGTTRAPAKPVQAGELTAFEPVRYTEGQPLYEGEPVMAYVRVGSTGKQAALTVNQGGEYPQLLTEPGEEVQVRLQFTRTEPDSPIALTAQDGGLVVLAEGGLSPSTKGNKGEQDALPARSTAGVLDGQRQIGFAFRVSGNPGIHRVSVGTPSGETKVLEFWAGPPPKMKEMSAEIEAIGQ